MRTTNTTTHAGYLLAKLHEILGAETATDGVEPEPLGAMATTGAPRPQGKHYPTKGVGGIASGNPAAQERRTVQNTFPWNGQPIRQ